MNFTFLCAVPPASDRMDPPQRPPLLTTFTAVSAEAPAPVKSRADSQARYRARNNDTERTKARARMARLRSARREEGAMQEAPQEALRRKQSSDRLRATPLFAAFRTHAHTHLAPLLASPGAEFADVWDGTDCVIADDEVAACLGPLRLDFKITDVGAVACFDKLLASHGNFDEEDLEFMFRHGVPPPSPLLYTS
ncbi:hypothetical protein B0H11DRAFT_2264995 [Mycena galericulata]|nr:hypothetical protein B0H11DRAFT_2264995 [Mycena galericulata]